MFKKLVTMVLTAAIVCSSLTPALSAEAKALTGNPEFSREIAHEGMVLMENNGALPLDSSESVALFGINQFDYLLGGDGSAQLDDYMDDTYTRGVAKALRTRDQEGKAKLYEPLTDFYEKSYEEGYRITNEPNVSAQMMNDAKNAADTAIITLGRRSGENYDRHSGKGSYQLSDSEKNMIDQVTAAGFEKVIVVLNYVAVSDSSWFYENDKIDAVLLAWTPGMEGGNAIADVLYGDAYPSGKLVDTWAESYADYPGSSTFNQSDDYTNYEEDIYVGYRYFETIPEAYDKVNYEFGYGLSYTTFAISEISSEVDDETVYVSAKVTNTGDRAGKEVVQAYYSAPQGVLGKPKKELAAYAKTEELKAGESQVVEMSFAIEDMASYDDLDKIAPASYVLEKGDYKLYVGTSVRDVEEVKDFTYSLAENKVVEELEHRVVPKDITRRMLADGTYENLPAGSQAAATADAAITETQKEASVSGRASGDVAKRVMLQDVAEDPSLMPAFIDQLTDADLVRLSHAEGSGRYAGSIGNVNGIFDKYGIPELTTADGPAGVKHGPEGNGTWWPSASMMASSWNPDIAEEFGAAVGDECIENGVTVWLAPGMNIHRDPLCGRNFEYYSEDPLVAGKMAAAVVRGVQSKKVAVAAKHFAANNKENNRYNVDSRMSERALREIYLRPFEITVKEGNPWTVMSSYNVLNGVRASENYELLTEILRNEWGYENIVITDWWNSGNNALEIKAGSDVKMPTGNEGQIWEALNNGSLARWELERNAERIMQFIMKTYTFEKYEPVRNEMQMISNVLDNYTLHYVNKGEIPSTLPAAASARTEDGETRSFEIIWPRLTEEMFAEPGMKVIYGSLADTYNGVVKAKVIVDRDSFMDAPDFREKLGYYQIYDDFGYVKFLSGGTKVPMSAELLGNSFIETYSSNMIVENTGTDDYGARWISYPQGSDIGYMVYHASDITGFALRSLSRYDADLRFKLSVSSDGENYTDFTDYRTEDAPPGDWNPKFHRGTGLPEGTNYLRIEYPQGHDWQFSINRVILTGGSEQAWNEEEAGMVMDRVDAIGEVTLKSEMDIKGARALYEGLTEEQKKLITNYEVLAKAEKAYADLVFQKAVQDAIAKINTIGEVTLSKDTIIKEARQAYENLTEEQKKQVTNYDVLVAAEKKYEELLNGGKNEVVNTGNQAQVIYKGVAIDLAAVKGLFAIDENAGKATYSLENGGNPTGVGMIAADGKTLTVRKAGTFTIGLVTEETDTHEAGDMVTAVLTAHKGFRTAPAAPKVSSKTKTSITIAADAAMEFSRDGKIWQISPQFTGLAEGTAYTFYQRYRENDLYEASAASEKLTAATDKKEAPVSPAKGYVFTCKNLRYKVTKAATGTGHGAVQVIGAEKKTVTSLVIPAVVEEGGFAFDVESIGKNAFKNYKKVRKAVIGKNVKKISNNAFYGCQALKSVTIGKNVTEIGSRAFYNDKKLTKLTVKSSKLRKAGKQAFKNISKKAVIKVPAKKVKSYKKVLSGKGQSGTVKIQK